MSTGSGWPRVIGGATVWACCVSSIGPTCQHKDAGLGVGHIWTMVQCPAYRTLDGADCTCGGAR